MMNMEQLGNNSGKTTEEQLQEEIAGDDTLLIFHLQGQAESFLQKSFKQGVTFEWVKNQVAETLEAKYEDLSLWHDGRRIPEPFCLVDMGVTSGAQIEVQLAEGAVLGQDALREQVLKELAEQEAAEEENKGQE